MFKLAYKKLPAVTSLTAHKLNIEMAPLSLVFIPGLWKRLKHFFSADAAQDQIPNIDTDILTSVAQEKYDLWMKQTQNEITRIVHRMMEGKSVTKVILLFFYSSFYLIFIYSQAKSNGSFL